MNWTQTYKVFLVALGLACCVFGVGCNKKGRDRSDQLTQALQEQKTKTDDLRKAMKYLDQITPFNREFVSDEVQMELNTWLDGLRTAKVDYKPTPLLSELPKELIEFLGAENPQATTFSPQDINYLFEKRMMQRLSEWIVDAPLRDTLLNSALENAKAELNEADAARLGEAMRLFDWTIRNIMLFDGPAASVEQTTRDPRLPLALGATGVSYMPWETTLFSRGDFIQRGRVFGALAHQRGITAMWISVGAKNNESGNLFAMAVPIGERVYVFEPKLGLPILDPDQPRLATWDEIKENPRVLRRLDLPGQFDYAIEMSDLEDVQVLVDATPFELSFRAKQLEASLLGDERMKLFVDCEAIQSVVEKLMPATKLHLWQTPLLATAHSMMIQKELSQKTEFQGKYMTEHGVWLLQTPAAQGRLLHLAGKFENTLDAQGALSVYMNSRVDDASIAKLAYDPEVQRQLGVEKQVREPQEQFDARVLQAQSIYGRAKFDAAFLLAQLHFDRGNFDSTISWIQKRILSDERPKNLYAASNYVLARAFQEQGKLDEAEAALTEPSPQEPGNRLRLRYLKRTAEPEETN